MGYIAFTIGLVVVVLAAVFLLQRGRQRSGGRLPTHRPVERTEPAADEPTPGASDTAGTNRAEKAQEHTPPA